MNNNKKGVGDLQNEMPTKARMPRGDEFIGVVEKRLGGSRMNVRSADGRDILARVPGRVKKFLWIREGDIVLLQPWEFEKSKADLIYKYKPGEVRLLEKKGMIGNFEQVEEF
ncbi:MAG: translation initiation factor eIF-1A [Nanoarchaeota archaeon]